MLINHRFICCRDNGLENPFFFDNMDEKESHVSSWKVFEELPKYKTTDILIKLTDHILDESQRLYAKVIYPAIDDEGNLNLNSFPSPVDFDDIHRSFVLNGESIPLLSEWRTLEEKEEVVRLITKLPLLKLSK